MHERDADTVDGAIRQVLEAERLAVEDVARQRVLAASRLQQARATALAVAERAERRIARVRAAVDTTLGQRGRAADALLAALACEDDTAEIPEAGIRRAVEEVAAAVSGSATP